MLDNLGAHKGERVCELVEGRGYELLFLSSYSPGFSPIKVGIWQTQGAAA